MTAARENYFVLLALDPSEDDWRTIEKTIKEKRTQWSRDKSMSPSAKRKREAARNLDLLPNIEKTLKDSDLRRKEAEEARQLFAEWREKETEKLKEDLKFLSAKGHVLEAEVEKLVKKYQPHGIGESDVLRLIKVDIQKPKSNEKPDGARLDASRRKQIQEELEFLGFSDLYAFLDMPRSATLSALQDKAEKLGVAAGRNAKKTPDVSARQSLAGICKTVFASEEECRKYNSAMADAGLERLNEKLKLLAGGTIDRDTFDHLVEIGADAGATAKVVEVHIREWAKKQGKALEVHAEARDRLACGACGGLSSKSSSKCNKCGALLTVDCPGCSTQVRNTLSNCGTCGFPTGDFQVIQRRLNDAKEALRRGDLSLAEKSLDALRRLIPVGVPFAPIETITEKIRQQYNERTDQLNKLKQLINERRMEQASRMLESVAGVSSELRVKLRNEIQLAMSRAFSAYELAVAAESKRDSESAISHCFTALGIVADHSASRKLLTKYPPQPIPKIDASSSDTIAINWQDSASVGSLEYVVVRARRRPPAAIGDGETVGRTAARNFVDRDAVPGVAYFYTVFVNRAGSHSAGVNVGPLMAMGEVTDLVSHPLDGTVSLSWKTPENSNGVEVRKCLGLRFHKPNSELIKVGASGLRDTAVSNGETYTYRVVTTYKEPTGTIGATPGLFVTVTPAPPPPPVTDLQIVRDDRNVEVRWSSPQRGEVMIFAGSDSRWAQPVLRAVK